MGLGEIIGWRTLGLAKLRDRLEESCVVVYIVCSTVVALAVAAAVVIDVVGTPGPTFLFSERGGEFESRTFFETVEIPTYLWVDVVVVAPASWVLDHQDVRVFGYVGSPLRWSSGVPNGGYDTL